MIVSSEFDQLFGQVLLALAAIYFGRAALGGLLLMAARLPGRIGAVSRTASARVTPALVRRLLATIIGTAGVASLAGTGLAHAMETQASTGVLTGASTGAPAATTTMEIDRISVTGSTRSARAGTEFAPPGTLTATGVRSGASRLENGARVGDEIRRSDFAPLIDRVSRTRAPRPRPNPSEIAIRLDRAPRPGSYPAVGATVDDRALAGIERGRS